MLVNVTGKFFSSCDLQCSSISQFAFFWNTEKINNPTLGHVNSVSHLVSSPGELPAFQRNSKTNRHVSQSSISCLYQNNFLKTL